MTRAAAALFCAAVLSAASVRPAVAQGVLQQCDRTMADAVALSDQVTLCMAYLADERTILTMRVEASKAAKTETSKEASAKAAKLRSDALRAEALKAEALKLEQAKIAAAQAAQASTVVRSTTTVWLEVPAGTIPEDIAIGARAEPLASRLMNYYVWSAFAAGDTGLCAPLGHLNLEPECRLLADELSVRRGWIGTVAEFRVGCGLAQMPGGKKFSAECCEIGAVNRDKNPCAQLVPRCMPDLKSCEAAFSSPTGDGWPCQQAKLGVNSGCADPADCALQREECRSNEVFAQAFRAKNIALCGASERCRVLMGEGKRVVQEQEKILLKSPAGRWFVHREWTKPARKAADVIHLPASTTPPVPVPTPTPGIVPVPVPTPTPGLAARTTKAVPPFKGFVCEEPLGAPSNRKAAHAVIGAARACLTYVEILQTQPDVTIAREIDAREEKLARLTLRLNSIFDGK